MIEERIVQIMTNYGLNAVRFAEQLGIQPSGISHILTGRRKPSKKFLHKVLTAFPQINTTWLFEGKGSMLNVNTEIEAENNQADYKNNQADYSNNQLDKSHNQPENSSIEQKNNRLEEDLFSFEIQEHKKENNLYKNALNIYEEKKDKFVERPQLNIEKQKQNVEKQNSHTVVNNSSAIYNNVKEKQIVQKQRKIEKILVFYTDNTYEELLPKK